VKPRRPHPPPPRAAETPHAVGMSVGHLDMARSHRHRVRAVLPGPGVQPPTPTGAVDSSRRTGGRSRLCMHYSYRVTLRGGSPLPGRWPFSSPCAFGTSIAPLACEECSARTSSDPRLKVPRRLMESLILVGWPQILFLRKIPKDRRGRAGRPEPVARDRSRRRRWKGGPHRSHCSAIVDISRIAIARRRRRIDPSEGATPSSRSASS